ncbi:MAG: hypothetical protein FWE16_03950 [Firmicutes bacterium]|nr:hypothetical protein [Bacillota bacterium]
MQYFNKPKRFRPRANRYRFTINNPILSDVAIKVLNPDEMTDEQKELYERNQNRHNSYADLKAPEYEKFFDFAICEYEQKEFGMEFSKVVAERIFFKSYEMAQEYFKIIDFIDYVCFQYEQGALTGTKHLQGFMHFYKAMDFNVVRSIFPTIHLDKCSEVNSYYIDYCRKDETKLVDYPFFSHGVVPADERTRTDMNEYMEDVLSGMSKIDLFKKYPHLTLQMYNKIAQIQQDNLYERFKKEERQLHVTYIYGKADAGKTTYPRRVLGYCPSTICKVIDYNGNLTNFDEYNAHDIILFDEFLSQIPLTKMNDYLDGQPSSFLKARYGNKVACYTKAFVISNYPLDHQYKNDRPEKQPSYEGFLRRIHEIIYMPERNHYIWKKGRPTDETIAKLEKQGAKITLLPFEIDQIEMGVQS